LALYQGTTSVVPKRRIEEAASAAAQGLKPISGEMLVARLKSGPDTKLFRYSPKFRIGKAKALPVLLIPLRYLWTSRGIHQSDRNSFVARTYFSASVEPGWLWQSDRRHP
jgi:hypothetical protein